MVLALGFGEVEVRDVVPQRVRAVQAMLGLPVHHLVASAGVGPHELFEARRAGVGAAREVHVVGEQRPHLVEAAGVVGEPPTSQQLLGRRRVDGAHSGSPMAA